MYNPKKHQPNKLSLYMISQVMIDVYFSIKANSDLPNKQKYSILRSIGSIKKQIENLPQNETNFFTTD